LSQRADYARELAVEYEDQKHRKRHEEKLALDFDGLIPF
jgi:hypothetical protein